MASTYLSKTFSSSGNRKTWTFSAWVKRATLSTNQVLFSAGTAASHLRIYDDDKIGIGVSSVGNFKSSGVIRDTSGWYHIVYKVDTTLASNRVTLYINGSVFLQTDAGYSLNADTVFNNNIQHYVGQDTETSSWFFDGSMSHIHFIDGTAYDASAFGETDSTTGEWKIKTSPSVTYGNNGFFILKDGNSVTDQSGNSNNWTVGGGTLTKTEDNPSNVFNLFNKLVSQTGGVAGRNSTIDAQMFNGNTTIATSIAYWTPQLGNMEMFSGKYYWEQKFEVDGTPSNYLSYIGIEATDTAGTNLGSPSGRNTDAIAYGSGGDVNKSNGNVATYDTWTAGDIVMCAVDLDNNYIYFGKNGTWQNSGDPTSGATGTGGIAVTTGKSYITAGTIHRGGNYSINTTYSYAKCNFGNGFFGTQQVSSAGTNASGIGIFEYDVPTGYTALSTKGLNL
jgi:hypothetical protein